MLGLADLIYIWLRVCVTTVKSRSSDKHTFDQYQNASYILLQPEGRTEKIIDFSYIPQIDDFK